MRRAWLLAGRVAPLATIRDRRMECRRAGMPTLVRHEAPERLQEPDCRRRMTRHDPAGRWNSAPAIGRIQRPLPLRIRGGTRLVSCLFSSKYCSEFASGSEEYELDARGLEPQGLRDFFMRRSLSIGKPQGVTMPRFELRHRARKLGPTSTLSIRIGAFAGIRCMFFGQFNVFLFLPVNVGDQVARDSKQVVFAMRFAFVNRVRSEEAVVRLLQEVVGQFRVVRAAEEICPQRPGSAIVKAAKSFLVHLKRFVRFSGCRSKPLKFRESCFTHVETVLPCCRSLARSASEREDPAASIGCRRLNRTERSRRRPKTPRRR